MDPNHKLGEGLKGKPIKPVREEDSELRGFQNDLLGRGMVN